MASSGSFTAIKGPKGAGVTAGGFGIPAVKNGGFSPAGGGDVGIKAAPAALKASAPTAPAGAPTPAAAPPTYPSPYDATYFVDLAASQNKANQQIAGYQRDIANGQTNLGNTLTQLKYNQGLANTKAQDTENQRGGFAQGALGEQLGQIGHQYQTTASSDTLKYQQDVGNWNAAIAAVQQGMPLEQIALGLASAARQSSLGLQAPGSAQTSSAVPPSTTPAAQGAGVQLNTTSKATAPKKGQKSGIAAGGF